MTGNAGDRLRRRDRQAIKTADLDDKTLNAILTAEPGERSKQAGKRLRGGLMTK